MGRVFSGCKRALHGVCKVSMRYKGVCKGFTSVSFRVSSLRLKIGVKEFGVSFLFVALKFTV